MINIILSTLIVLIHLIIKSLGSSIKKLMLGEYDIQSTKEELLAGCLYLSIFLAIVLFFYNITLFPLLLLIPIHLMKPFSLKSYLRKLLKGILEDDQ